jgi:hypothetical protein
VVLTIEPLRVDDAATQSLRARMRAGRNWDGAPAISWEPMVLAEAVE